MTLKRLGHYIEHHVLEELAKIQSKNRVKDPEGDEWDVFTFKLSFRVKKVGLEEIDLQDILFAPEDEAPRDVH